MAQTAQAENLGGDLLTEMKCIRDKHKISFGKQVLDYLELRGTGLTFEEYIAYGLYARDKEERTSFVGSNRARAAYYVANKMTSWDAAEDKLFFATLVSDAGAPTPKILGLVHETRQTRTATPLRNESDIAAFLKTCPLPIFGKPVIGVNGKGTIRITERSGDNIIDGDGNTRHVDEVASDIMKFAGHAGYMLQEVLNPSAQIDTMTGGKLATARFFVLIGNDGPELRQCVLRLPANGNDVDSFTRAGNLIAPVDVETGRLGAAKCGVGTALTTSTHHPDTQAAIEGIIIDGFADARDTTLDAAAIYPDLHMQSWDVAFTDQGPSLVEMNPGGHFRMLQLAGERGVFDPAFHQFLQDCVTSGRNGNPNPKAMKEAKKLLSLS